MADGLAGGLNNEGTFTPIQLWAGEPNGQSTQGTAAAGYEFGQKNARGDTYLFPVVALVAGLLVPWNPLADSDVPNAYASATVTFSTAVPAIADFVEVGDMQFTFVNAAGMENTPSAGEAFVLIGATLAETATNLKNAINAHRTEMGAANGVIATSNGAVTTVKSAGTAGNAVTISKTAATGANITVSGANLSGGTDSDAEAGGARVPYAVLPHALDTTAAGYNAQVDTPYFISGHFNFDALDLPEGTTYQEIKAAFAGSMINIQKLY